MRLLTAPRTRAGKRQNTLWATLFDTKLYYDRKVRAKATRGVCLITNTAVDVCAVVQFGPNGNPRDA